MQAERLIIFQEYDATKPRAVERIVCLRSRKGKTGIQRTNGWC